MAHIEISGVRKTFEEAPGRFGPDIAGSILTGQFQVGKASPRGRATGLDGVDLDIPDGKVLVILGPSGCGKSSLLRIIAGLMKPDAGTIRFDGEPVDPKGLPPDQRGIGMVFQEYALYPTMKAKRNILSAFIFKEKKPEFDPAALAKFKKTSELLGVEMASLMERSPGQLSGGERQRVAIGRCITRDPKLFLMDEPFSSLDAKLRETYRVRLKLLLNLFRITTVYVTHDQREAQILADRVAVMGRGRVEQVGEYKALYDEPVNAFVAGFVGLDPELPAISLFEGALIGAEFAGRSLGVRPEDFEILETARDGSLRCSLLESRPSPMRDDALYTVKSGEQALQVRGPARPSLAAGTTLWLRPRKVHVFAMDSGERLETRMLV